MRNAGLGVLVLLAARLSWQDSDARFTILTTFTMVQSSCMKRATVTLPDDLAEAVENYQQTQEAPPSLTAVVQAALRQYLGVRGFLRARRTLAIAPAHKGSGLRDISQEHDRYLANGRSAGRSGLPGKARRVRAK